MSEDEKKIVEISELGEFGLIEHLTKSIKIKHSSTVNGVGDDAAVLNHKGKHTLVTTDILIEGIHFDLVYTPLKHLGYKAAIVNFSDIYAMNAIPKQITVSIAVSSKISLQAIEQIYQGIYLACDKYDVDLIGGDTSSSVTGMVINITAIGEANKKDIVYRNGAKINDIICVSGNLGAAYMGLQLLEREKAVFNTNSKMQPEFGGNEYILEKLLKPEARKDIIELFLEKEIKPTSMIDVSDGLSSELFHICTQSETGCSIYEDKLPININTEKMAKEFNIDPTICALNGGEDYELLFTISVKDYDKIKNIELITVIGHITNKKDGLNLIVRNGTSVELQAQGWNTLKNEE